VVTGANRPLAYPAAPRGGGGQGITGLSPDQVALLVLELPTDAGTFASIEVCYVATRLHQRDDLGGCLFILRNGTFARE
jgi:hypothetical protein